MKYRSLAAMAILIAASSGCMSFSSTPLKRFDSNQFSGESNGQTKLHEAARPFKGIPITLRVPSHLDIYIDETYFFNLESASEPLDGQARLLNVRTEIIKTDKVFTVDFKRPGSGTLDLKLTFDEEEQYFKKIVSKLEDTTITDSAALVASVVKRFGAFSASTENGGTSETVATRLTAAKIERDSRVVAYKRFDINSPTFELDVECFVNEHLNGCNECCKRPDYDTTGSWANE